MNNQISTSGSELSQKEQNQIILYRPNDTISLEVRLENDTVWLTQMQIAELFDVNRTSIVKHKKNIYTTKELEEISTCAIFSQVRLEGNRKIIRDIPYYNLDMIPTLFPMRTHGPCVPTICNSTFFTYLCTTSLVTSDNQPLFHLNF